MSMEKQEQGGAQKNDDRGRGWVQGATNYGVPGLLRVLKACRAEKRGANQEPYGASLRLSLTDSAKDLFWFLSTWNSPSS